MEAAEVFKLVGDYGLVALIALVMWRGLPSLIKTLRELKDEFIKALHEHSDKDMARHEETREAIRSVREQLLMIGARPDQVGQERSARHRTAPFGTPILPQFRRSDSHHDEDD